MCPELVRESDDVRDLRSVHLGCGDVDLDVQSLGGSVGDSGEGSCGGDVGSVGSGEGGLGGVVGGGAGMYVAYMLVEPGTSQCDVPNELPNSPI